jgi:diadenosine tetraphosphatase ApaH/serine/threonine PP2A family protein phosphatase
MRIAVLSDVHSNLVALDAVLASVGSVDAIWQLGDVVGYGPDPNAVVERLRSVGAVGVRGNHDAAALGGDEIEWFNPDARAAVEWTKGVISDATRRWLGELPSTLEIGPDLLVHGSPRDPMWEYVTSRSIARANLGALERAGCRVALHGHTHVPIAFRARDDGDVEPIVPVAESPLQLDDAPVLLNPGSVGQPRDGDPAASWLELDTDAPSARWHRVAYDVPKVQAAIRAAGLPGRLADRLAFGL